MLEHDAGEWIDPNVIVGEVANLHDAALAVETLIAMTGALGVVDA